MFYHHCLLIYPTNIASAARQQAIGGQPPNGGQPTLIHWVARRWAARSAAGGLPDTGHLCAYSFILLPTSVLTDVPLHWFWPPTAKFELPLGQFQWHRFGFQPSTTSWIVVAGLLCAEPPHDYQQPTGGPLDVIRWPPLLPSYHHSLLGGQLQNVCRVY